jgi:hypothetical protein
MSTELCLVDAEVAFNAAGESEGDVKNEYYAQANYHMLMAIVSELKKLRQAIEQQGQ